MKRISISGVATAATALALLTAVPTTASLRKSIAGGAAAAPATPALAPVKDAYREMLTRPLFSATRRPAAARDTEQRRPAGPLPVLRGVVITPNRRIAVLEYGTPRTHQRVREGQRTDFGTVERIGPNHITIRVPDGVRAELRLKESDAVPSVAGSRLPSRPQKLSDGPE